MQIPGGNVSEETAPTSPSGESEQKKSKHSSEKGVLDKDVILDDTSVMHVTIQSTDSERPLAMAKLSPFKTIELLQELIGEYPYSKPLNSGALLVQCAHREQVKILMQLERFVDCPVKVKLAFFLGTVRGVIGDPRLNDMNTKLLVDKLRKQNVCQVRPLFTGQCR